MVALQQLGGGLHVGVDDPQLQLAPGSGAVQEALPTTSALLLDGADLALEAYNINGNNYFKLRDLGSALNFGVDWDGAANTVVIDTAKGYTP